MQELVAELWRLEGPNVENHIGDLAWQHRLDEWRARVWEEAGEPVAFGRFRAPATLQYEIHPAHRPGPLHDEVLDWFEAEAEADELRTSSLSTDDDRLAVLRRRGYDDDRAGTPFAYHARDLAELPEPAPEGVLLRTVGPDDLERRVEVHRAAFAPSRLTVESYAQATWPYRADLDCVAEAADGSFASFCLAWLDAENRVGELEPVGTHPDHRRRGLAAAVCLLALRRLREEGATRAIVYSIAGSEATALYEAIGLREHARSLELVKRK